MHYEQKKYTHKMLSEKSQKAKHNV